MVFWEQIFNELSERDNQGRPYHLEITLVSGVELVGAVVDYGDDYHLLKVFDQGGDASLVYVKSDRIETLSIKDL